MHQPSILLIPSIVAMVVGIVGSVFLGGGMGSFGIRALAGADYDPYHGPIVGGSPGWPGRSLGWRSRSLIMDGQELRHEKDNITCTGVGGLDAALASHRAGNLPAAAALYEQVLAGDGSNVRALHLLGLVRYQQGDYVGSAGLIGRALALWPDFAEGYNDLGTALRSAGRLDEARLAYLEAIRLAPRMAVAHANLGLVYLQEARFDKAWCQLSRATKLDPNCSVYWEYLAELHGKLEQFQAAIRCWDRMMTLTPNDRAYPHLAIGRASSS